MVLSLMCLGALPWEKRDEKLGKVVLIVVLFSQPIPG